MRAIIALAFKDLRLLSRDKFGLFWLLMFPLMMALFFGSVFSGSSSSQAAMTIAMVDLDQTYLSRSFIAHLDSSSAIKVIQPPEDSARILVRKGNAVAYLILQPGFGAWGNMFSGDTASTLVAGIDPSRQAEAGYLQGMIMEAWFAQLQSFFTSPQLGQQLVGKFMDTLKTDTILNRTQNKVLTDFLKSLEVYLAEADTGVMASSDSGSNGQSGFMSGPKIKVEDVLLKRSGPRSSWEITFPQALLWALIGCSAAFAVSIVTERTRGTLLRLRMSPISRGHILAGKGLACFITAVFICTVLLAIGKFIFGVSTPNLLALGLAIVCSALCFVGLMMLISVLGKTEQAVGGAGWAILLVFSMTGGGMIPLMFLPQWMLTLSNISPVKWGIYALEGAIWRDFTMTEMMLPLSILTAIGIVTFTAGVLVFKKTN